MENLNMATRHKLEGPANPSLRIEDHCLGLMVLSQGDYSCQHNKEFHDIALVRRLGVCKRYCH